MVTNTRLPVEHFEERITARVFRRTAEDGVLENMRHSSRVGWSGAEIDGKNVIRIVPSQMNIFAARSFVFQTEEGYFEFGYVLDLFDSESAAQNNKSSS